MRELSMAPTAIRQREYNKTPRAKAARAAYIKRGGQKRAAHKWSQTPKANVTRQRYWQSAKGKAAQYRHNHSAKYKATRLVWLKTASGQAYTERCRAISKAHYANKRIKND